MYSRLWHYKICTAAQSSLIYCFRIFPKCGPTLQNVVSNSGTLSLLYHSFLIVISSALWIFQISNVSVTFLMSPTVTSHKNSPFYINPFHSCVTHFSLFCRSHSTIFKILIPLTQECIYLRLHLSTFNIYTEIHLSSILPSIFLSFLKFLFTFSLLSLLFAFIFSLTFLLTSTFMSCVLVYTTAP